MSIATEITRLQGIKSDIRTALVTQGISQASSHNMADFSADILAIQGSSEGVYITVTCNSVFIGHDIILSANETELDRKQCPSSLVVNFFVSADDVTLPAIFTISNSLNDITTSVTANMYGWYDEYILVPLIPKMTSNTTPSGEVTFSSLNPEPSQPIDGYLAFDGDDSTTWFANTYSGWVCYKFDNPVCVKEFMLRPANYDLVNQPMYYNCRIKDFTIIASKDGNAWDDVLYSGQYEIGNLNRIPLNNNEFYRYYKINILNTYDSSTIVVCGIQTLQYYGLTNESI